MIYCVFPGCGKTTYCKNHLNWVDIDYFPFKASREVMVNYIKHCLQNNYNLLISAEINTLNLLKEVGIEINIVMPSRNMKEEMLERFKKRDEELNDLRHWTWIQHDYDSFYEKVDLFTDYDSKVYLRPGEFISNILDNIV